MLRQLIAAIPLRLAVAGIWSVMMAGWGTALAAALSPAGLEMLQNAPAANPVVVYVDVEGVVNSEFYRALKTALGEEDINRKIKQVEVLFGINIERDIRRVVWSGQHDGPGKQGCALIAGTFDGARLITLLELNAKYAKSTYRNLDCHAWFDDKENRMKYGSFLKTDLLAVADSEAMLRGTIDASLDKDKSLLQSIPPQALESRLKGSPKVLIFARATGETPPHVADNPILSRLTSLLISADMTNRVEAELAGVMDSAQTAADAAEAGRGFLALGRLMDAKPIIQTLAKQTTLTVEANSIFASMDVENDVLIALIKDATEAKSAGATAAP